MSTTRNNTIAASPIPKLAIVVVTYKRQNMLQDLFDSIAELECAPWRIVVVDNEDSRQTAHMTFDFDDRLAELWGIDEDAPDTTGKCHRVIYAPQRENGGGAGGFSAGVQAAYELGAEWFWLMDDDVLVLPEAIERLSKWTERYQVVQAARLDFDDGPFFWQYQLIVPLGIPNPVAKWDLGEDGFREMNQLCFEGGLFSRAVVDKVGLPDPRFFIYGDDACYGYVASKHFDAVVVADLVLKRARVVSNWDIAGKRQLNSTSDINRYYIMRNRGFLARYLKTYGDYNPLLFRVGTFATFCKELIRLAAVDKTFKTGVPALRRGMKDGAKILRDKTWEPMPPMRAEADEDSDEAAADVVLVDEAAADAAEAADVSEVGVEVEVGPDFEIDGAVDAETESAVIESESADSSEVEVNAADADNAATAETASAEEDDADNDAEMLENDGADATSESATTGEQAVSTSDEAGADSGDVVEDQESACCSTDEEGDEPSVNAETDAADTDAAETEADKTAEG